jgi:hypothetical protein
MEELLDSFFEFLISHTLELGKQPGNNRFEAPSHKLQTLRGSAEAGTPNLLKFSATIKFPAASNRTIF